jgi:hypothetical protein
MGTSLRRKNGFSYPVDALKLDAIGKRRRRIDRHGIVRLVGGLKRFITGGCHEEYKRYKRYKRMNKVYKVASWETAERDNPK